MKTDAEIVAEKKREITNAHVARVQKLFGEDAEIAVGEWPPSFDPCHRGIRIFCFVVRAPSPLAKDADPYKIPRGRGYTPEEAIEQALAKNRGLVECIAARRAAADKR